MRRGAAVAALAASGAAASVASAAACGQPIPGYGRRAAAACDRHPTPTGSPPVPRDLHDAAGHDAVGEHVVIVVAPFAGGARGRLRINELTRLR